MSARGKADLHDPRKAFRALDVEGDEEAAFNSKIARAAERAMWSVDIETIALYRKYKIKLTPRLEKIANSLQSPWFREST